MDNTREKLIEILRKTRYEYRHYIAVKDYEKRIAKTEEEFLAIDDSIVGEIPFCADYLLSNGVTVQKWIPVTERLPEYGQQVIVYTGNILSPMVMAYIFWDKDYDGFAHVTHWMPLPEPPKGD